MSGVYIAQSVGLRLLLEPYKTAPVLRALGDAVGIAYPIYATFKAIEEERFLNSDHKNRWLTYWAAYGTLLLAERGLSGIAHDLPFYEHMRLALVAWLLAPPGGARWVYDKGLRRLFVRYEPKIDVCLEQIQTLGSAVHAVYRVPLNMACATLVTARDSTVKFVKWFTAAEGSGASHGTRRRANFMSR